MIEIGEVLKIQITILQIELEIPKKIKNFSKLGPKVFKKIRNQRTLVEINVVSGCVIST
jgi:NurA-like 5'-3' nuclease